MFPFLLLAFVLVPIVEIAILIRVSGAIGGVTTIMIVIFTAIIGAYLVRQQGFATLQSVQNQMNAGRVPAMEMAEGLALLFAGALLLTPGFFTDAIGFTLLAPPCRRAIIRWLITHGNFSIHTAQSGYVRPSTSDPAAKRSSSVIEGEFKEDE
jgi:UPF0716 protein FxsA